MPRSSRPKKFLYQFYVPEELHEAVRRHMTRNGIQDREGWLQSVIARTVKYDEHKLSRDIFAIKNYQPARRVSRAKRAIPDIPLDALELRPRQPGRPAKSKYAYVFPTENNRWLARLPWPDPSGAYERGEYHDFGSHPTEEDAARVATAALWYRDQGIDAFPDGAEAWVKKPVYNRAKVQE